MMPAHERLIDFRFVAVSASRELGFGMNGVENAYTDAVAGIKAVQTPQGNWSANEAADRR